jgi:hypothetical protein
VSVSDQISDTLNLPRWAYVPGVDTQADRVTLDRVKALVPERFDGFVPASHAAVLYGLRLNNEGFFWEAHEILEAVWKVAPKGGLDRICLRACIQIANANLKLRMGKLQAVKRLIADAAAELTELTVRRRSQAGDSLAAGFPAEALAKELRNWAGQTVIIGTIVPISHG